MLSMVLGFPLEIAGHIYVSSHWILKYSLWGSSSLLDKHVFAVVCVNIHACECACMLVCVCIHTCACTLMLVCVCTRMCYAYFCVCACAHVCTHMSMPGLMSDAFIFVTFARV